MVDRQVVQKMNPLSPFIGLVKALWEDTVDDFKAIGTAIKRTQNDEPVFRPGYVDELKQEWKSFDWTAFFKAAIPLWTLAALGFFVGFFIASQRYEMLANEAIIGITNACNAKLNPTNFSGVFIS